MNVERLFFELIGKYKFQEEWTKEGIQPPSNLCMETIQDIYYYIHEKYKLLPERIAPTVESGLILYYSTGKRSLSIEVDNTLESAGIVCYDKSIQSCKDLDEDTLDELLDKYLTK